MNIEDAAKLPAKTLHNRLVAEGKDPAYIHQIKELVRRRKEQIRLAKRERRIILGPWRDLIAPLAEEIHAESANLRNHEGDMLEVRTQYVLLLKKLRERLRLYSKTSGKAPGALAREKGIPNSGAYWPDWVPEDIKRQFNRALHAIPRKPFAKRKELFRVRSYDAEKAHRANLHNSMSLAQEHNLQMRDHIEARIKAAKASPQDNQAQSNTLATHFERQLRILDAHIQAINNARHDLRERPIHDNAPATYTQLYRPEDKEAMKGFGL
jgi:hypothetical protein